MRAAILPSASGSASFLAWNLRLAAWAQMLGLSGHFSTKSRAYSTTLGTLRADRAAYQRKLAIAAGLLPNLDGETTVVHTDWHFAGHEHPPFPPLTGGVA